MAKHLELQEISTSLESEIVLLCIALKTIDDAVNKDVLNFKYTEGGTVINFPTMYHQNHFYVRILDFLSVVNDIKIAGKCGTCLELLQRIGLNPSFNIDDNATLLLDSLDTFNVWIEERQIRDISFWSLNQGGITLDISRKELINITANISKHHFGRLSAVIALLQKAKPDYGKVYSLTSGLELINSNLDILLKLDATMTAQLMNDIRLGIYHYLLPHYLSSYKYIDEDTYRYRYPKGISTELGMACWWDLMEFIKNKPLLDKFTTDIERT